MIMQSQEAAQRKGTIEYDLVPDPDDAIGKLTTPSSL